jgi:hypothetical protein
MGTKWLGILTALWYAPGYIASGNSDRFTVTSAGTREASERARGGRVVKTRSTSGNANNRSATNGEERAPQPRRRKGREEEAAPTPRPEMTAATTPTTPGEPGRRAPRARARAQKPTPPATVEPTPPTGTQPMLPAEVVDEAAPLAARVPTPTAQPAGEAEPVQAAHDEAGADGGQPQAPEEPTEISRAGAGAVPTRGRRGRERGAGPRGNALGALIELRFSDPSSPVRSYSELERRSAISREALSRYVTPRADRRRSPTIDTLAAIADALHLSLEQVCRAAVASARGLTLPPESEQRARDEVVAPLVAMLTEDQFAALVELIRQMQPR